MSVASHAWGGLREPAYSECQAGCGRDINQHFAYEFQLLRVMAEDAVDGSFSGLYVTLTFPVRVVLTAVYQGYGAVLHKKHTDADAEDDPGSYSHTIKLCAPEYADRCPRFDNYKGRIEPLQVHGERRGPLEQEENEGSLMAVAIDCKSKSQFLLRPPPVMHLARRPPSPPPIHTIRHSPPPSPSPPPDLEYLYEATYDDSRIVANEAITISSRSIRPPRPPPAAD